MKRTILCLGALLLASAAAPRAPRQSFDILIRGGEVHNGEGRAPFTGSVGIRGDRIVYVGPNRAGLSGRRVIDARGMAVLPGLIDVHTHPDS